MVKQNINISEVFWSVSNLKFADDVLSSGLGLKKELSGKNFNIYLLPNKTKIIAFDEKDSECKLHDSCLKLSTSKVSILSAYKIFKKLGYHCYLTKSPKYNLVTLSCFAPSPNRFCEVNISNTQD